MKKALGLVALGLISLSIVSCGDNKPLPFELVGEKISKSLCDKYEACYKKEGENQTQSSAPIAFDKERCLKDVANGVADRLKGKKDAKVIKKNIEDCRKTIESSGCEVLTSETAPTGCEFLQ